jgi:transposase InsO family protein
VDKGRFLVEPHLRTGQPLAELARAHEVSRGWLYKLLARYRLEGPTGLEPRSRRPHRSPTRISDVWEDEIVALRKELAQFGDAGAETIHYHLSQRHGASVPSMPTIWRVLRARGFVIHEAHKRPKSSWKRFVADFPNECWQADVTHVEGAEGMVFEVLNMVDDHSRLCVASHVFVTTRSADVARTLHKAAKKWGYPERLLTDNGLIFSTQRRHDMAGALELELLTLGIASRHSRPYHPQTCGKVERFHQTLKKFLVHQDPAHTKKQLQSQLDRFVAYYNGVRPHRGINRRPPLSVWSAQAKASPGGPKLDIADYRVRRDKVDKGGGVTLRYQGRLHHIGVGRAYKGWRVILLVAGTEVRILGEDGSPLRRLTLDPTVDYQPMP